MSNIQQKEFSYTALRHSYTGFLVAFTFYLLIEGGLIVLLITVLVHNWLLMLLLHTLTIGLSLAVLLLFLSPLWTRHQLTDTHLLLHYGFAFKAKIPRANIVEASPVQKELAIFEALLPRYAADKQRVTISFGNKNQVFLKLNQAQLLRVGFKTKSAQYILLNVDDRDLFLNNFLAREALAQNK